MTTDQSRPTTTDAGIPVESDEYSLTVGPGGPILLQDSYLIEQVANFNRERIPERQPHAKGSGAVFFVKDPLHFQNFIRSQKRRADSNLRDAARDRLVSTIVGTSP